MQPAARSTGCANSPNCSHHSSDIPALAGR